MGEHARSGLLSNYKKGLPQLVQREGIVEGVDVHLDCKRKKKQKPTGKDEDHFWNLTPYFLFQKFKTDRLYYPELIGAGWEVPRNSLGI